MAASDVRIFELAQNLGTTVRALRHYEDVGLLRPERSRGNARIYGRDSRRRASLIVELRLAGVALDDISQVLAHELDIQRREMIAEILRGRIQTLEAQRARVTAALTSLDAFG